MKKQSIIVGVLTVGLVLSALARFGVSDNQNSHADAAPTPSGYHQYSLDQNSLESFATPPQKKNNSTPGLNTKAAYLVDIDSGYPLYGLNEREPIPIASTTKLMTAAIVIDSYKLDDVLEVSQTAASTIGSEIQLIPGEKITVESLLKALLIQSGNDAAMTLAEHIGLDAFVAAMNAKAIELGMIDSHYKDPAGLDDSGRSSARDLGIIAAYDLRKPELAQIVRLTEADLQSVDGKHTHHVKNSNRLIQPDSPFFLPEATGFKTGYTPDASHCLVASAQHNKHTVVSVILGTGEQTAEASAKESKKLLTWGFDNFVW